MEVRNDAEDHEQPIRPSEKTATAGRPMTATNFVRDATIAPILQAADLAKRYGEDSAISDVAFSVNAGEVLGIVGPNGAGKTTLLEVVAGLVAADLGRISWRGEDMRASRRKDAMFYLPDGVRPYQDRFAIDVVSFFAAVYGRSEAAVAGIVTSLELVPVLRKRVSTLSKGYNRRLILAVGLLMPQPLLLMDEPFDGFDLRQTRNIIDVIRDEARKGRTFVLAIHQLADAARVCDRFILLAAGRVKGVGSLDELRAQTGLPGGSLEEIFLALT
jgi:ABC-2 type transport system ATP-binding protein